jgi:hypothetical protein
MDAQRVPRVADARLRLMPASKVGPEPIAPIVTQDDWANLPPELQGIVKPGDPLTI